MGRIWFIGPGLISQIDLCRLDQDDGRLHGRFRVAFDKATGILSI